MNRRTILIALAGAALLFATGFGMYRLGLDKAKEVPVAPRATERKVLFWHDPMVPGHKFDKPGKSPFMDMDLVPVYADEGAAQGGVTIDPRVRQNLGMRTAEVKLGSLDAGLRAVGTVAFNERSVALVQARSAGYIERLHARAPLDPVRKGQPLLQMVVPEWVAAQEEYLAIRRMGEGAGGLLDAARQRMLLVGMSEEQVRQLEAGGKANLRMTVVAPVSGVITELSAREGMTVVAGAPLFRINGLDPVWVNAALPESAAAQVRQGTAAEASTAAYPGTTFKGKVGAILPEVNAATRTLTARIELANPGGKLVPGMFATIRLAPAARDKVLLVPSEAVIQTGMRTVVMLDIGDGKFAPADVETGFEANGLTAIRSGLAAGQKVVVSGQFLVDSEASLRGTAARQGGGAK